MVKSSKFLIGLILSIMPLFLILGFSRMLVNKNQDFLMTPLEFQNLFLNMPNFLESLTEDIAKISSLVNKSNYNVSNLTIDVSSLTSAWADVGGFDAIVDIAIALASTFVFTFNVVQQFFIAISGYFSAFGYCFVLIFDCVKIPIDFLVWFVGSFLGLSSI